MRISTCTNLSDFTSFGVGGPAEKLVQVDTSAEFLLALQACYSEKETPWIIGSGTNSVISDKGLPGTTIISTHPLDITKDEDLLIVSAGSSWDEFVQYCVAKSLWGIELLSGIPGTTGAAAVINIAAYGQCVADSLVWVEVFDIKSGKVLMLYNQQLEYSYKSSALTRNTHFIVLRAAFCLKKSVTADLKYESAIKIAEEMHYNVAALNDRRKLIIEARRRAQSLYYPNSSYARSAGSFFRNPMVHPEQISQLAQYDEWRTSKAAIAQNIVHGGSARRMSASLVLLAAGFKRGQRWGAVGLNKDHVLKVENLGGASAADIYEVSNLIIKTVKEKLDIEIVPEVSFLGDFS